MLRFFRTLRRKLLEEDNVRKYFWYALGEVLLVVIGILIALQINNWNEERNQQEKVDRILIQIKDDLQNDIQTMNGFLVAMHRFDSLATTLVNNSFTEEDFANPVNAEAKFMIYNYQNLSLGDVNFQSLATESNIIPEDYEEIYSDLSGFYSGVFVRISEMSKRYRDYTAQLLDELRKDNGLILELFNNSEQINEYMATNPKFVSDVMNYRIYVNNLNTIARTYRVNAYTLYQDLRALLELEESYPDSMYHPSVVTKYEGTYYRDYDDRIIEIVLEDSILFGNYPESTAGRFQLIQIGEADFLNRRNPRIHYRFRSDSSDFGYRVIRRSPSDNQFFIAKD